jgi:hypothetical protein
MLKVLRKLEGQTHARHRRRIRRAIGRWHG